MPSVERCPYCGAMVFSGGFERRPGQTVERCEACLKYSCRTARGRFALTDPNDAASSPCTNSPR